MCGFYVGFLFCGVVLDVLSTLLKKRELVVLLCVVAVSSQHHG